MTNSIQNIKNTVENAGVPPTPPEAHQQAGGKSMNLVLQNGYPFPYPDSLSEQETDEIAEVAGKNILELKGICNFQWLHTVTVEFINFDAYEKAKKITGWKHWDDLVLEAPTSQKDGYMHPAIIASDVAYCGFMFTSN